MPANKRSPPSSPRWPEDGSDEENSNKRVRLTLGGLMSGEFPSDDDDSSYEDDDDGESDSSSDNYDDDDDVDDDDSDPPSRPPSRELPPRPEFTGSFQWVQAIQLDDAYEEYGELVSAAQLEQQLTTAQASASEVGVTLPDDFCHFIRTPALHKHLRSYAGDFLDLGKTVVPWDGGHILHFLTENQGVMFWYLYIKRHEQQQESHQDDTLANRNSSREDGRNQFTTRVLASESAVENASDAEEWLTQEDMMYSEVSFEEFLWEYFQELL